MNVSKKRVFGQALPGQPKAFSRLYTSGAIEGDIASRLGAPHYSYHFAERRLSALLASRGVLPRRLAMPEYYGSAAAMPYAQPGPALHLIFRSTDQIRLLKHATNICCFPWEFPVLKTDISAGEHPFSNQVAMLGLCDEVWTPSRYAMDVMHAHGLAHAHHVPAPVERPPGGRRKRVAAVAALAHLATIPLRTRFLMPPAERARWCEQGRQTLGDWLAARAAIGPVTIYLSILNPEDFRKNLDAMLRGFHHFQQLHPHALLVVKVLTSRERFSLAEVASDVVPNKLAPGTSLENDSIVFINAFLDDDEMSMLYSLADFYVCTSLAEGQNLPLLEAMAHGTVPVSTANTAMADYIGPGCAFLIPEYTAPNDNPHLAGTLAGRQFDVSLCSARGVFSALCAAEASGLAERSGKSKAGLAVLRDQFSHAAVWARIAPRLEAWAIA